MLRWRFEGSNDMIHWTLLDNRRANQQGPIAE